MKGTEEGEEEEGMKKATNNEAFHLTVNFSSRWRRGMLGEEKN